MLCVRLIAAGAALVSSAAASLSKREAIAAYLAARQNAEYTCHVDCGNTILDSQGHNGYCRNQTWIDQLNRCLACANTAHLWPDYGSAIDSAADACSLTATPGAVVAISTSATSTSTSSPTAAMTVTTSAATGSPTAPTTVASTSATVTPTESSPSAAGASETSSTSSGVAAPTGAGLAGAVLGLAGLAVMAM